MAQAVMGALNTVVLGLSRRESEEFIDKPEIAGNVCRDSAFTFMCVATVKSYMKE